MALHELLVTVLQFHETIRLMPWWTHLEGPYTYTVVPLVMVGRMPLELVVVTVTVVGLTIVVVLDLMTEGSGTTAYETMLVVSTWLDLALNM